MPSTNICDSRLTSAVLINLSPLSCFRRSHPAPINAAFAPKIVRLNPMVSKAFATSSVVSVRFS